MDVDLHGFHPDQDVLAPILRQLWEMGQFEVRLIHGHGRNRGLSPGFVNTNTGYLGLAVRSSLRKDTELRQWIHYTSMNCGHNGSTWVRLKKNPSPSRSEFDWSLIPTKQHRF